MTKKAYLVILSAFVFLMLVILVQRIFLSSNKVIVLNGDDKSFCFQIGAGTEIFEVLPETTFRHEFEAKYEDAFYQVDCDGGQRIAQFGYFDSNLSLSHLVEVNDSKVTKYSTR